MTSRGTLALIATLMCGALVGGCQRAQNGQRGGEPEQQLALATVAGDLDRVKRVLSSGADPNKMTPYEGHDQSPWKLALRQARPDRKGSTEIVRAMLASHANPEVAFGDERSKMGPNTYTTQPLDPILEAVSHSAADVVRALLDAGLDRRKGQLALVLAVEQGESEIVHILVDAGVSVNCHPTANTPLTAAIETRNVALMTYLEEHGARERPE
jgi:ankyrin repeat protein